MFFLSPLSLYSPPLSLNQTDANNPGKQTSRRRPPSLPIHCCFTRANDWWCFERVSATAGTLRWNHRRAAPLLRYHYLVILCQKSPTVIDHSLSSFSTLSCSSLPLTRRKWWLTSFNALLLLLLAGKRVDLAVFMSLRDSIFSVEFYHFCYWLQFVYMCVYIFAVFCWFLSFYFYQNFESSGFCDVRSLLSCLVSNYVVLVFH